MSSRASLLLGLLSIACGGNSAPDVPVDTGTVDSPSLDAPSPDAPSLDAPPDVPVALDTPPSDVPGDAGCDGNGNGICDDLRIGFWGAPSAAGTSMFAALVDPNLAFRVADTSTGAASLDDALLAGCDVLVVESMQDDLTTPELGALQRFVEAGGGLVVMGGYVPGDNTRAEIASAVGEIFFRTTLYSGPVTWTTTHPVSEGLSPTFESFGGYGLWFDPGSTRPVLATTMPASGSPENFVVVATVLAGRVLVLGDENLTLDRAWGADSERFWRNTMRWVSGG